jgi:hypothetical protein
MSRWVKGCGRMYGRLARAFPHEFRMICGDGLERLGQDIAPLVRTSHLDHRRREASSDCRSARPSDSRRSPRCPAFWKPARSPDHRSRGRGRRKDAGQRNVSGIG